MQEGVIAIWSMREVKENKNFLICLVRSGTFIVFQNNNSHINYSIIIRSP